MVCLDSIQEEIANLVTAQKKMKELARGEAGPSQHRPSNDVTAAPSNSAIGLTIYEKLEALRQRIRDAASEPTYGLHRKKQMPFFRILRKEIFGDSGLSDDQISTIVALTKDLCALIEREIALTGFWNSAPSQNKLQGEIQKMLVSKEYGGLPGIAKSRKAIITRLMELDDRFHETALL